MRRAADLDSNSPARCKFFYVRQKPEPAASAILMSTSTDQPERIAEILREIITLSETRYRKSEVENQQSLESQGNDGIDLQRPPRREIACGQGGDCEQEGNAKENDRIARINSVEKSAGESG
jgi:hypothetical protein